MTKQKAHWGYSVAAWLIVTAIIFGPGLLMYFVGIHYYQPTWPPDPDRWAMMLKSIGSTWLTFGAVLYWILIVVNIFSDPKEPQS